MILSQVLHAVNTFLKFFLFLLTTCNKNARIVLINKVKEVVKINPFNKEKLSKLILKAIGNDRSLNQYALHCDISSAHISRLSRGLLDTPPTPQVLQKMSDASQGRVTYSELMEACGYIDDTDVKINIDDADIAFYNGVKGLNDTNKAILKGIIEGLTAKQKEEEKNMNDKK